MTANGAHAPHKVSGAMRATLEGRGLVSEIRNVRKTVRLSETELELLESASGNGEISCVLRIGGLRYAAGELDDETLRRRGMIWVGADNDGARERAHQLKLIGGNVNQAVRALNLVARILNDARLDGTLSEATAQRVLDTLPDHGTVADFLVALRNLVDDEEAWVGMLRRRLAEESPQ